MSNHRDVECMSLALRLAKRGLYTTRPNPNVGCVISDKYGHVVGTGYHSRAGQPHAEIHALKQAGDKATGGTAYVTLEPCCHQGKTGPCTQALIDAEIARVVIAIQDPNPLVAGKGVQHLQHHGIHVTENLLSYQAEVINRGFIKRMSRGLPWVMLKMATSIDGRTSLNNGQSKWITSEHARYDVQKLRAKYDAILTGIGTVIADDPSLNVRLSSDELNIDGDVIQPYRIVIDPDLKISLNAKLLQQKGKTLLFTKEHLDNSKFSMIEGCEIIHLPYKNGKFNLKMLLEKLSAYEINSVMIEAGPILSGELINSKLVDELVHYVSPKLMGNTSKGMLDIDEIKKMDNCISLEYSDIRKIGDDLRITSLINY
ncbi:MAG: bifunctional diaminohydroxyphosphoribosylaminopyrimidine deaminase/5-amino-6-(5-phosphoribosylamino)uracil reductase RibD [Gammaproteobacteria bacterium]|nr:bifunctional diaminohydroxyphosphoribosylaminopyrimidine deaminase/5-amino-6-(5-phosphoribosylamino)uracil reductase RibD [Gammaproteobacteria bacterium]